MRSSGPPVHLELLRSRKCDIVSGRSLGESATQFLGGRDERKRDCNLERALCDAKERSRPMSMTGCEVFSGVRTRVEYYIHVHRERARALPKVWTERTHAQTPASQHGQLEIPLSYGAPI